MKGQELAVYLFMDEYISGLSHELSLLIGLVGSAVLLAIVNYVFLVCVCMCVGVLKHNCVNIAYFS